MNMVRLQKVSKISILLLLGSHVIHFAPFRVTLDLFSTAAVSSVLYPYACA